MGSMCHCGPHTPSAECREKHPHTCGTRASTSLHVRALLRGCRTSQVEGSSPLPRLRACCCRQNTHTHTWRTTRVHAVASSCSGHPHKRPAIAHQQRSGGGLASCMVRKKRPHRLISSHKAAKLAQSAAQHPKRMSAGTQAHKRHSMPPLCTQVHLVIPFMCCHLCATLRAAPHSHYSPNTADHQPAAVVCTEAGTACGLPLRHGNDALHIAQLLCC
jgi:hypothetical protein